MPRLCPSLLLIPLVFGWFTGCGPKPDPAKAQTPKTSNSPSNDLASLRKGFKTQLRTKGPAPQHYEKDKAPVGARLVTYQSGDLALKGWLSENAFDGKTHPAVVFLHGGWAFGDGDWEDAEAFVNAGFVLFMPMLRGENGNPGIYESFLGEVDDAIAAGQFLLTLPNVDRKNIFVSGHSVGAVLTCLVTMMPSPFKAGAALDGYVEMKSWAAGSPRIHVPYDPNNPEEVRLRNPMEFVNSLQCPLRLYAGHDGREVNTLLADKAKQAQKDCKLVIVKGGHQDMVEPAVQDAISWFKQLAGK